jgi:hypothetical protein
VVLSTITPGSPNDFDSSGGIHKEEKLSRWDEFLKNLSGPLKNRKFREQQ